MRDPAIVTQLRRRAAVEVGWLAPAPAGDFLRRRGCRVVPQSDDLAGRGRLYDRILATRTDDFNLMASVQGDTRLHRQDFLASVGAWRDADYGAIVGDGAFWLLSGFVSGWYPKPAPFVPHRSHRDEGRGSATTGAMAEAMMGRPAPRIPVDDGGEIADIVLQAAPSRCAAPGGPRVEAGRG
jgi:hypothetical protein